MLPIAQRRLHGGAVSANSEALWIRRGGWWLRDVAFVAAVLVAIAVALVTIRATAPTSTAVKVAPTAAPSSPPSLNAALEHRIQRGMDRIFADGSVAAGREAVLVA